MDVRDIPLRVEHVKGLTILRVALTRRGEIRLFSSPIEIDGLLVK